MSSIKGYCPRHYKQIQVKGYTWANSNDRRDPIIDGNVAKIPIGFEAKNGYMLVDIDDVWVAQYNFFMVESYVGYFEYQTTKKSHRLIMGVTDPLILVDHKNGDKLDNRRSNLRVSTLSQNIANSRLHKNNTSGYKGVRLDKKSGKWIATITCKKITYHLGTFKEAEEAARAYDAKARELFGEFACLNFPKKGERGAR